MTKQSKLEWTEYKSRFRATTAYGTYWIEASLSGTGYIVICDSNPCCSVFSSPQRAQKYAQMIHDRPSSRDDWFNLSDVEQAPYHAPLDLSELLRTYETLLAGDNLPKRIAVQTVDLKELLNAAKPVNVVAGLEQAAKFINQRINDYVQEHGVTDPETGTVEFPGWGDEYVSELEDLAEAIRALYPAEPAQGDLLQPSETLPNTEALT